MNFLIPIALTKTNSATEDMTPPVFVDFFEFENAASVSDDAAVHLDFVESMTTAVVDETTYLFTADFWDSGVSAFAVGDDGSLSNVANVSDDATLQLCRATSVATAVVGGTTYLFAAGAWDNGISVFAVGADGSLANTENITDLHLDSFLRVLDNSGTELGFDNDGGPGRDSQFVFTAPYSGLFYLSAGGLFDDSSGDYVLEVSGGPSSPVPMPLVDVPGDASTARELVPGASVMSSIETYGDRDWYRITLTAGESYTVSLGNSRLVAPYLISPTSVTTAVVDGTTYLFVSARGDNGEVSVFEVGLDGALNAVASVADDDTLELKGASSVTTAVVDGTTFLFAAGRLDDGISVFAVGSDGSLANIANVTDDATLELDDVISLTTAVVDGTTFLFAAGRVDHGVSVFAVGADGSLKNTANVTDGGMLRLFGVKSVTTAELNGKTYLFVAAQYDDTVTMFAVGADGSLRQVRSLTDDDMLELQGPTEVTTTVVGGIPYLFAAGASDSGVNVLRPVGDSVILIGNAATSARDYDRIIADRTPIIAYSVEAGSTVAIDWGDGIGFVATPDRAGAVQQVEMPTGYASDGVYTVTVRATDAAGNVATREIEIIVDTSRPRATDDELDGTAGADVLDLWDGDDILRAGAGDDIADGGRGNDTIFGDSGADLLRGGEGHDRLEGGDGDDRLFGEAGRDIFWGLDGDDLLVGGDGVDVLRGHGGDDTLLGDGGDDRLYGYWGNDHGVGGNGNDLIEGGRGDDRVIGALNNDTLHGGGGLDTLEGGTGFDQLAGGSGSDALYGGHGADILNGGRGNDLLTGGFGFDTFFFADGFGMDMITDFDALDPLESIDFAGVTSITSFADLTDPVNPHMTQVGTDVVIDDFAGNTITIQNTSFADLDASDFVF